MSEKWGPTGNGGAAGDPAQIREHLKDKTAEELWDELDKIIENSTDVDLDTDLVDEYLRIIREKEEIPEFDVETSLFRFQRKHSGLLEVTEPADQQSSVSDLIPKRRRSSTIAVIVMVLTLLAVLVLGACEVLRFFFKTEPVWTEDVFQHRVTQVVGEEYLPPEEENIMVFDSLEEALDYCDMTSAYIPTWFPEGYAFCDALVLETPETVKLTVNYRGQKKSIVQIVRKYRDSVPLDTMSAEKDGNVVKKIVRKGVIFHVMNNNGRINATWVVGTEAYQLTSDTAVAEVEQMIQSIHLGGD